MISGLFNHNFKDGDFTLFDKKGNEIYIEKEDGYWELKIFSFKKEVENLLKLKELDMN